MREQSVRHATPLGAALAYGRCEQAESRRKEARDKDGGSEEGNNGEESCRQGDGERKGRCE
jgi:hypothetical protein